MTDVALDSNILIYLAGISRNVQDDAKIAMLRALIDRLVETANLTAPTQALGELFVVSRRSGLSAIEARTIMQDFAEAFGAAPSGQTTVRVAADLVVDHKLQYLGRVNCRGGGRGRVCASLVRGHAAWLRRAGRDHRQSARRADTSASVRLT